MTVDADFVDVVTAIVRDVAETVIMPRFGDLSSDEIAEKSSKADLVTAVDIAAERALREALREVDPDAGFVGEEAAAADPSITGALGGPGRFWIVDPIDGTRNFVRGEPEFGVIVALVTDGVAQAGWIHAAPDATTYAAARRMGAWSLDRSGRRAALDVAPQADDRPTGLRSLGWLPEAEAELYRARLKEVANCSPSSCSAYAYIRLATGAVDFKISSRIHAWDHVAGALMVEELGGEARYLDNDAPFAPADSADRPLLAVAPGRSWRDVAGLVRG
ncbi:MAG: inositol monophosphatase family protein [Parvularculaceae bacterium]